MWNKLITNLTFIQKPTKSSQKRFQVRGFETQHKALYERKIYFKIVGLKRHSQMIIRSSYEHILNNI